MGSRLALNDILKRELRSDNVYFQPPEKSRILYPCVIYSRQPDNTAYADDKVYRRKRRYTITVIDKNPDSEIPNRIAELPLCAFDRCFTADNLNHYVFTIYF